MKLAIHHRKGSFSDGWVEYCKSKNIDYKVVNAYNTDIIGQVKDCQALLWHHHHANFKDVLASNPVLFALEHAGVKVFPDFKTAWHFDDKVAQKYLLEAIGAPHIPSYVFYDKKSAIKWANTTSFPKVFKLKGGAGAANVKLVRNKKQCLNLINKAFGKGFSQFDGLVYLKERARRVKGGEDNWTGILKGLGRLIIPTDFSKHQRREKDYVYFQEFIPGNDGDYRLIVINRKYAYGMKRLNRENDFRASGSSKFIYQEIPGDIIKTAFETAKTLNLQSIAFDFILGKDKNPLIIEMSYGFGTKGSSKCEGYWTEDLQFHKSRFNPQWWMVEQVLEEING